MAKMQFRLPEAAKVYDNPSPDELKALAARDAERAADAFGNLNVQTEVVSRSKGSTFIVTDEPDGQNQAISREEYARVAERQDEYIADREMVVVDGYIGHDPEFRVAARLYIEAANANIAGMQQQLYFPLDGDEDVRARAHRHLHAEPEGGGLPGRPPDHRRPRERRHARLQLGLLRRVEEGRPADVEQARLRPRRAGAARRLQDHPDRRRRQGRADRRPVGHRQDDDDVHAAERLAAGAGRLRRVDAERQDLRRPRTAASPRRSGSTRTTSRRSTAR